MKHVLSAALFAVVLNACSSESAEPTSETDPASLGEVSDSNDVTAPVPAGNVQTGGKFSSCKTRAYEEIGGPISLIDQNGEPRTQADFKGKPALVFFGFTYCPDVCPATLVKIDRALERLDEAKRPVPILISVDSERDTPEALSRYLSLEAFPENTVGLTGSEEDIRAAAKVFIADYTKVPLPDSAAEYTMDHTSLVYLMDENWKLKTFFNYSSTDEDMANCLKELL